MALNIVGRLPSTLAGMAAGKIDRDRARVISNATLHLSDDLAAEADKILAGAAPGMRLADLHKKAAGRKAPLPALINITIPAGTLLGWSNAPADVGSWGLIDAGTARDLIEAASRHPRTRWCYTLTGPDDQAIAHACARGTHPWPPPPTPPSRDHPTQPRLAQLTALLTRLNAAPEPVARGTCDHAHGEDHYTPSRKLKHLIRARTARCCAPGCGAQAITSEIDHTRPYPAGASCQCNLGPLCQRHHHAKHAPGWKLQQTQPGVMRWTTPSGRTYTTHPTEYEE